MRNKVRETAIRREVAFWQTLTVCFAGFLALLVVCVIAVGSRWDGVRDEMADTVRFWEGKYTEARGDERNAVAAYEEKVLAYERLVEAVELERERCEEQARAYEAVGVYEYIGTCTLTAYCCESKGNPHICGDGDGLTATGLPVAPGMVAVDPKIIPLGSTVIINGTSYLAADTGVKGYHIDIAIQTHEDADAFGVSSAEVWIIPPGGDGNAEG